MIAEPSLDAPDEDWLVWADAMQQIGDPRGELLALGHADAYVRHHADALFGRTLGRHVRKRDAVVTKWRRCYADEIELRIDDNTKGPQLVVDTLAAPCARTLRGLAVAGVASRFGDGVDLAPTLGWLRESTLPPSLISLSLVDDRARSVDYLLSRNYDPGPNLVNFGPLAELWRAFAQLEHLTMVVADPGAIQFQVIRLPALRSFTLHALCWVEGLAEMLAGSQWPRLRSIDLRCCDTFLDNNPTDATAYRTVYTHERQRETLGGRLVPTDWHRALSPLLTELADLSLERLALTSFENADSMLDAIEDIAYARTLVELDLSDSGFDTRHAAWLANHPLVLQLKRVVLERVRLSSAKALAGLGPEVVHSCRPGAPTYRYIVGME